MVVDRGLIGLCPIRVAASGTVRALITGRGTRRGSGLLPQAMQVITAVRCALGELAIVRGRERIAVGVSGVDGTVGGMTAQPAGPVGAGEHEVIHLGGEAAVVVPVAEYRRLRALEQLASAQEREDAETAVALEEYREWSAAGRPGAISHEEARRLLLGGGR